MNTATAEVRASETTLPTSLMPRLIARKLDSTRFPDPASRPDFPPAMTMENVEHLLAETGISARYDVIKKEVLVHWANGEPAIQNQIVSLGNLNKMTGAWLLPFVGDIAKINPYNAIAEWIASKPWDGTDRLPEFYATVQVAEGYPAGLKEILLRRWMLSATAAATLDKRFACRGVLTLQGPQSIGKTSWVASILPEGEMRENFIKRDHHLDPSNKDSIFGAISHFIVEIGELDSSFRKDIARLKGFLTNDCDKMRRPYARGEIEMDRRTVFAATVNDENFLVDPTGNSRFWTISVEALDYLHTIDMQQLFAQLRLEVRRGEQWWLTPDEERQLGEYNLRHRGVSAIEERLADLVDHEATAEQGKYMTAIEVLRAMGISQPSNRQCKECGSALRERFGAPKRVNGRDKWRVPLVEDTAFDKLNYPVSKMLGNGPKVGPDPEDRF